MAEHEQPQAPEPRQALDERVLTLEDLTPDQRLRVAAALLSTDGTNNNANCGISAGAERQSRRPVGGGVARKSDPELCCFPPDASALSGRAGPPRAVTASRGFGGAPSSARLSLTPPAAVTDTTRPGFPA